MPQSSVTSTPWLSTQKVVSRLALTTAMLAIAAPALAKKSHKAHEHGAAKVSVAVDGTKVLVTMDVPAEGIYGFEHTAKTDADKKQMADGLALVKSKAGEMFRFDAALACTVKTATAEAKADTHDDEHHDKKGSKAKGKEGSKKSGHDHDHHDDHDDDHKKGEHTDVDVAIEYACAKSPAGTALKFGVSKIFPRIKSLKVEALGATNQSATTVTNDQGEIKL